VFRRAKAWFEPTAAEVEAFRRFVTGTFVLMLADFTALPAALWILFRARPDADRRAP